MNKKEKKLYEAPTLSASEVRIEKAFLTQATASGNLPDGAEKGYDIDHWFDVETIDGTTFSSTGN